MGVREQEDGKSECRSVTDRIRVQTLPDCESRQTSIWCSFAREFEESFYGGKQMTASCFDDRCAFRPVYCQKTSGAYRKGCYVMHYSRVIRQGRAFGMLEPYDGKLSRRVLRGLGAGNSSRLPDGRSLVLTAIDPNILIEIFCRFSEKSSHG